MPKFKAWYRFCNRVWLALSIGWLAPIFALLGIIRSDQSGAILICATIVAEVLHEKGHRRFVEQVQPGVNEFCIYREVDVPESNRKDVEISPYRMHADKTIVDTTSWPLYHLSLPEEFFPDAGTRIWNLDRTMRRAERVVDYSIVATAIAGTVLWAFA